MNKIPVTVLHEGKAKPDQSGDTTSSTVLSPLPSPQDMCDPPA
jgi:hypothetical protein